MKKIVTLALAVLTVVACSIRPEKNLLKSRE
jgi:uncharacterized protein YcfL